MTKIQNSKTPRVFSLPIGERAGVRGNWKIGNWDLFGLPARSRFGEGRDLGFVIWDLGC
jgi:hypothetical protein